MDFIIIKKLCTSDLVLQLNSQSYSVIEKRTLNVTPDLTCSMNGSTQIFYTLSSYSSSIIPSWVSINPVTAELSMTAPSVSADYDYYFYIDSGITGSANFVKKLIKITVIKCTANNWDKWSTSKTIWEGWASGYNLTNTGTWYIPIVPEPVVSESAQAMTTTTKSMTGSTAGIVGGFSLANTSSLSSLWSMVNQMQI